VRVWRSGLVPGFFGIIHLWASDLGVCRHEPVKRQAVRCIVGLGYPGPS
jgi:hypothetical protein